MSSQFKKKALSIAVAQAVLVCGGAVAQTTQGTDQGPTVVVSGQRQALQDATKLKQNSDEIIDAVVAEEAGKLPDKSITEVLQRVAGVTMDRNRSRGDPEHFSVEGSGITVRGLTWGSSTLNGRESFSAGGAGRELSWGDVPPELMSAVIVHKNPPADLVEGGVSGQVDLRTALPFDYKGDKFAFTVNGNYNALGSKKSPGVSGLYSTRWENSHGQWGALLDLSANETNSHNDTVQLDAFYPRTDIVDGQTVYAPKSASWRTNTSKTDRAGLYGALQWKKNGMQSALTYFHSAYRTEDNEQALFTGVENPYKSKILNPVFDSRGVLQSGTYTYPTGGIGANNFAAGGLGLQADTGFSSRRSQTRELAWNFKWTLSESWSVQNDLQWVHATDSSHGSVVTLGTFVPSMGINLSGNPAQISFDANARAFLANPGNYYTNFLMPSLEKASGDLYAWKTDARYVFDHPVLRDLRFGMRLTDRKANMAKGGGNEWTSVAEPWGVRQTTVPGQLPTANDLPNWGGSANVGYFSDPRYAALVQTTTYGFPNFFNGKVATPPTVVVPTAAFTNNYPGSFQQMMQATQLQCEDGNKQFGLKNQCTNSLNNWKPLTFDGDPSKTGRQQEKTQAVYATSSFGFDQLRFPVEGSAGVRVVRTQTVAHGYTVFKPDYGNNPSPELPLFGKIDAPIDVARQAIDVLPSLNLKLSLTDKLQARFAAAKSMYRPNFSDLREYTELKQDVKRNDDGSVKSIIYTGTDKGNGNLRPTKADSYDLTLEWYPGNGTSLTAAAFRKNVRDIILYGAYNQSYKDLAGNSQSFLITAPDNSAKGSVTGLELAGQTYFDHVPGLNRVLPDWAKGFGVSANYTYIDSKQTLYHPFDMKYCAASGSFNNSSLNLFGCDTNGLPFDSLPLMYLSKNNYNLIFMYDKGPLSARLAYSWRSRFLQGVTVNGTQGSDATSADPARKGAQDVGWGLPTWQEATGQLDFGVDYRISDHVSASFSASNLTDIIVRQTQQQHIGNMGRSWFEPGRSYRMALRYSY